MKFEPGVSLILGGARSGKSVFAETLAEESGRSKIYLATSNIWDVEMEERVAIHRARRGDGWKLVEEPINLNAALIDIANRQNCVLVDCLTLWVTNLMMGERDIAQAGEEFVDTLKQLPADCSILLVSNEVGQGIVPIEKMAREFRDHSGHLHQIIAAAAQHVWFVTAGLPQKLK